MTRSNGDLILDLAGAKETAPLHGERAFRGYTGDQLTRRRLFYLATVG